MIARLLLIATLGITPNVQAKLLFRFADPRIDEASGIAVGVRSPGVFYVANDGGGGNRFFAVDARSGSTAATIVVAGASNVDWEDVTAAPDGRGTPSIWLADIGDNDARRTEVRIYRVVEPAVRASDRGRRLTVPVRAEWRLRYPDGPVNAESFAVTPDGSAYILTKTLGLSTIYELPEHPDRARVQLLRRVGSIHLRPTGTPNPFGFAGQLMATGAAVDGQLFVLRTAADAFVWRLGRGGLPAAVHARPVRVPLPRQRLGEGVAVRAGRIVIDSEGVHSAVYDVPVPHAPAPTTPPSPTHARQSRPEGSHHLAWQLALAGAALVVAALGFARVRKTRHHDR